MPADGTKPLEDATSTAAEKDPANIEEEEAYFEVYKPKYTPPTFYDARPLDLTLYVG